MRKIFKIGQKYFCNVAVEAENSNDLYNIRLSRIEKIDISVISWAGKEISKRDAQQIFRQIFSERIINKREYFAQLYVLFQQNVDRELGLCIKKENPLRFRSKIHEWQK